jgi:hypothetical protein
MLSIFTERIFMQPNFRRKITGAVILLAVSNTVFSINSFAQKETTQELTKTSKKGMLVGSEITTDGNLKVTYKMKLDKKSDDVAYEEYTFSKSLEYKGVQPAKETKTKKPDQKVTTLVAFVGGGNSFNVLSMKLTLQKEEWEKIWDYDNQKYKWGKRLSKETVKPKNGEGKYTGFAAYSNDGEGSVIIVASAEGSGKNANDKFVILYVDNTLHLKETAVPVTGDYSVVYTDVLKSGNAFIILAPNKGSADISKYVYTEFNNKGEIVTSTEFAAPSPNTLVMDYREVDGVLYLCAASTKENKSYDAVFASYAPIGNPGYSGSANSQMDKYDKKVYGEEFDNFHLIKLDKGKLVFATTTPIKSFSSKIKMPPSQKKADTYKGKKFVVQNFAIAPNGDYLVAGQLENKKTAGGNIVFHYEDLICLHFDGNGQLKAQYAVDKINDDSKSEVFQSQQNFFFSIDKKTVYWELLEVKGTKGYDSFIDAYNGNSTFTKHYFPRIAKIDLNNATVSDFTVLGNKGKFLMYKYNSLVFDEKTKTRYYVGHDDDYEKLWTANYSFE